MEKIMNSDRATHLLFTLGANPNLSKQLSSLLGIPLSPDKVTHFADGETFAKPLVDVKGQECYIIHSTYRPVSERLMDLLVFVDALHNAGAKKIVAIIPYFGYARQDRIIDPGDPISGLLVAKMLKSAGVDMIVTVDFHSLRLLSEFPLPHTNLTFTPYFAQRILDELKESKIKTSDICIVSPDRGGLKRAEEFAKHFDGSTFAFAEKHRPQPNKACVEAIEGDVNGKLCVIIDDIIDTAGTLSEVVKALYKNGATDVYAAATHGIFSGRAPQLIDECGLKKLFVSDTIEGTIALGESVSIAPLLAEFIKEEISK
jgi:ribose-phosphate pyrophosphokinase